MSTTGGIASGDRSSAEPDRPREPTPLWHTALRVVGIAVVAVVVIAVVRDEMPNPAEFWRALVSANWWWVALALVLEVMSIGMMIRQQRRLMNAFGVPVSYIRMGAITYSSTAIAVSVPAGGAVSAGYLYRKFRDSGANPATAASVMLLSGVMSIVALVLLYLGGLLFTSWTHLQDLGEDHPVVIVLIGLGVLLIIVGLIRFFAWSRQFSQERRPTPRLDRFEHRNPKLGAAGRQLLDVFHVSGKVKPWDWNLVLSQSAAKWLLDAASLYASTLALGLTIDLWKLALLYLAIQAVRQVPLTPGGIGLIEASLLAGLISAGAAQGPAAAAIVVYRLFSCWLLIPVGYGLMGALAVRDRRNAEAAGTDVVGPSVVGPSTEPITDTADDADPARPAAD